MDVPPLTMQAPANWPSFVVEGRFMTSGRSYTINQAGQIRADPLDVGDLMGYGFYPAASSGWPISCALPISLSTAQLLTLHSNPIELLPAPGPGNCYFPHRFFAKLNFGTTPFGPYSLVNLNLATPDTDRFNYILQQSENWLWGSSFDVGTVQSSVDQPFAQAENQPLILTANSDYNGGTITGATLNSGGSHYAIGDTGNVDGGDYDAFYVVDAVLSGAVTAFHFSTVGTGYYIGTDIATTTQTGIGEGFTVNITSVQLGDSTVNIILWYFFVSGLGSS